MRFFTRSLFLSLLALALILTLKAPAHAEAEEEDIIVAVVNGFEITEAALLTAVNNRLPLYSYHSSVTDEKYRTFLKRALDELIEEELYHTAAKEAGITVEKKDIDNVVAQATEGVGGKKALQQVLKNSNMTMKDLREDLERSILIRMMKETKQNELKAAAKKLVTNKYIRQYYEENKEKFYEPPKIRLREIHIKADPSGGSKEWDLRRAQIEEIRDRILAGSDFAEEAKKYSQDPYAAKGGDMGWAHEGTLSEEIETTARTLKKGELSEPIRTLYGYHLIRLEDRTEHKLKSFESLNIELQRKELVDGEYERSLKSWKKKRREDAEIVIHSETW